MGKALNRVAGGVCAVVAVYGLWMGGIEWDADSDLQASITTSTVSVRCIAPESVAFVPHLSYTLLPQHSPKAFMSCQANLLGGVNGEMDIPVACKFSATQHLSLTHATPVMKLAGLQCKTVTASDLDVRLDHANSHEQVFITAPHHSARTNDSLSEDKTTPLFGSEGRISDNPLQDGRDLDQRRNGEIAFGGRTTSTGGTRTIVRWSSDSLPTQVSASLHFVFNPH